MYVGKQRLLITDSIMLGIPPEQTLVQCLKYQHWILSRFSTEIVRHLVLTQYVPVKETYWYCIRCYSPVPVAFETLL